MFTVSLHSIKVYPFLFTSHKKQLLYVAELTYLQYECVGEPQTKVTCKCLISNNSQVFPLHMYVHMYPQAGKHMYILTCIACNTGCHENTAAGRWYLCHVAVCHRALKPTTLHFDPIRKVNLGETGNGGKGDCM